ncbi:hypothetical protein D3C76_1020960 [compost metagenome]
MGGQRWIGLDHPGDVVDGGIGVDPQLDDLLRGFSQGRDLDGGLQALLDTPGCKGVDRLADFLLVVVRPVEIALDVVQGFAEICGAGLGQHLFEIFTADLQQHARFARIDQQVGLAQ